MTQKVGFKSKVKSMTNTRNLVNFGMLWAIIQWMTMEPALNFRQISTHALKTSEFNAA